MKFTYHVIANRADAILPDGTLSPFSSERFAPGPGPMKSVALEQSQKGKPVIKTGTPHNKK